METKNPVTNPGEVGSVDIIRTLSQKKGVIFLSVFITLSAAVGMSLLTKPTYRAITKVLLRQEKLAPGNIIPVYSTGEEFLKSQVQIIRSRPIVSQALKNIVLANPKLSQENGGVLDVGSVQKNLSAGFISRTNILVLKVENENPSLAASLANAITQAYSNHHNDIKTKLLNNALRAIGNEIKTAKQHADLAERVLDEYTRKEQVAILPESEIVVDLKRFAGFDAEIIALGSDIQTLKTKLLDLKEQVRNNNLEELDIPLLLNSADIKGFQAAIRGKEAELSSLLMEYTIYHPEVINTLNVIERLKQDLKAERQKVVTIAIGSLEMEKKLLKERRDGLFKIAAQYGTRLNKILFSQPKLAKLLHNVRLKRGIHEGLLTKRRNLIAFKERSKKASNIQIIEIARVPSRPIKPNLRLNTLLGLIVGLGIGCGVALATPLVEEEIIKKEGVGKEKRYMVRSNIVTDVVYNILGEPETKKKCRSGDISGSGIRLVIDEMLPKGVILELSINIPKLGSIFTRGEVAWAGEVSLKEDGKGPFGAGVQFIEINPDDQEKLSKYLYENSILPGKENV